jgi:DNA repair exonuclease SbcCD nuclease subunit
MIRTKTKKIIETMQIDLIICSDIHLREDNPVCRTDDFVNTTQWRKMDVLCELQNKYNCPVIHAGDLFHHWNPSPGLLSKTIEHLPNQFYTVYGNHDLPQHNMDMVEKCGLYTLQIGGNVEVRELPHMEYIHWGMIPVGKKDASILVWHVFNYQGAEPWPGCVSPTATKLLKQYPQYNLIITGDNHTPFVQEYKGRLLVNPGSLSRQKTDETHEPRVYLYNAALNTVIPFFIPIEPGIITSEHLQREKQRDERISTFVSQLNEKWKVGLSFSENLKRFENKNNVRKSVMEIVYKSIEL